MKLNFIIIILWASMSCMVNTSWAQAQFNLDGDTKFVLGGFTQVNVSGGVDLKASNSQIDLGTGSLTISGEIQGLGHFKGSPTASLVLEGTGGAVLNFGPGFSTLGYLLLNRPGQNIILNSPLTVGSMLSLHGGILHTSSPALLTLGSSGLSLGLLNHTAGHINGPFKRWFAAGANVGTTGDFPVGDAVGLYNARIEFSAAPGTAGSLTAEWINGFPGYAGMPLTDGMLELVNLASAGYWRLSEGDGLAGGNYTASLSANGFGGVGDYNTLRIVKRAAKGSNWTLDGTAGTNTGSNANPIVVRDGMEGFSEFGIAGAADNGLDMPPLATGLNLDGVDDFVDGGAPSAFPTANSPYTIEAWIKPTDNSTPHGIAGWGDYGTPNAVNALRTNGAGDGPELQGGLTNYWGGDDLAIPADSFDLFDGNWHHVAATFDGNSRKIYVDGILRGQDNPSNTGHIVAAGNFTIGKTASDEYFKGDLDELRIWGRALCSLELLNNMNCEIDTALQHGLAAVYHFNQGIVHEDNIGINSLADGSGNGNTATLSGFELNGPASNWSAGYINGNCGEFIPPGITCRAYTAILDNNGLVEILPADVYQLPEEACGDVNLLQVLPNSFDCGFIGPNTVTLSADDGYGHASSCTATVTIVDNMPANIVCKNINIVLDEYGSHTIVPADVYNAANSSDNCGNINLLSVFPKQFDCGEIGPNTVTLKANDDNGNLSSCLAIVTVEPFITNVVATPSPATCGLENGSITVTASASGGQLAFSIDGGLSWQFVGMFQNLAPGDYDVAVQAFGTYGCITDPILTTILSIGSAQPWYKDIDGDGYTDGTTVTSCTAPPGYVAFALPGDCNDNNYNEHPGQVWYKDQDNDGYTDGTTIVSCTKPVGYVLSATQGDCDDTRFLVCPGATEFCNGLDDDCDGDVDEGLADLTYVGNVVFNNQAQVNAWNECYTVIQGNLFIQNSSIDSLVTLGKLHKVTGNVTIKQTSLDSLSWLMKLDTIGGSLSIMFNNQLQTLHGLDSLKYIGGTLGHHHNNDCAECCSIYDLLNTPGAIGGAKSIFLNETGCSSVSQINTACNIPGSNLIGPNGHCSDCGTAHTVGFEENVVVSVTPNPNNGRFNISLGGQFGDGKLMLYDMQGNTIWQQKVTHGDSGYRSENKAADLPIGLYLLMFLQDNGDIMSEKVIVK